MATSSPAAVVSTQYGAPIGEYRGSATNAIILSVSGAITLLAGVGILIMGIIFTTSPSSVGGGIAFALFGLLVIAMGLGCFWLMWNGRGAHAQLFEQGFVISRGGKTTSGRWDDITSVTQAITVVRRNGITTTRYFYTIALANGEKVRVDNSYGKVEQLGNTIQQMASKVLLPRAIESYKSGASLPFGTISISQSGISNGKETVPWSNIKQVTTQNGTIIIKRNDKQLAWVKTLVAKTPNFYILMALVDQIQSGAL